MNPERWRLGDRVGVQLPTGYRTGVVVGIDLPGLPRGVKVRFPPSVNTPDCYATYAELVRLPDGSEESRKLLRACLADPELRAQLEAMAGRIGAEDD